MKTHKHTHARGSECQRDLHISYISARRPGLFCHWNYKSASACEYRFHLLAFGSLFFFFCARAEVRASRGENDFFFGIALCIVYACISVSSRKKKWGFEITFISRAHANWHVSRSRCGKYDFNRGILPFVDVWPFQRS